jgi:DNA polymerase III subunit gamma/tau
MAYQVLARKYRPQSFADVIGQEHVTGTLENAIAQQRIAHGYIFSGHRGIGKTTVARILAMCLNCRSADRPVAPPCGKCESCTEIRASGSVDVLEIDAASNRGIDEIRELRDAARYRPARDRYKIYILDEAHQITDAAFNALLKTLEEPPPHVVFMMATTQPEDIPQTIRSRCQHFSFHAVRFEEIVARLRAIAKEERITADDDSLALLAEAGDGSMRDALSIMDQAIACCGATLTGELVRKLIGAVPGEALEAMMRAVAEGSSSDLLRHLDSLLAEGQNPAHLARQMVRHTRNALMAKVAGSDSPLLQISSDERARAARVAGQFSEEDLTRFLHILLRTYGDVSYKSEQRFHLELGLLKLVHAQRLLPIEELLSATEKASGTSPLSRPHSAAVGSLPPPVVVASLPRAAGGSAEPAREANRVSPFEQDRARKARTSESWASFPPVEGRAQVQSAATAPPAIADTASYASSVFATPAAGTARAIAAASHAESIAVAEPVSAPAASISDLRAGVVQAVEAAGHRHLAATLDSADWQLSDNELVITAAVSPSFFEMAMKPETHRLAVRTASAIAGRPLKLRLEANAAGALKGVTVSPGKSGPRPAAGGNGSTSARRRAAEDPVVQRLQEKFAAEIRTVIDHREKRK